MWYFYFIWLIKIQYCFVIQSIVKEGVGKCQWVLKTFANKLLLKSKFLILQIMLVYFLYTYFLEDLSLLLGWVKGFAIFWWCEAQFSSSEDFAEVEKVKNYSQLWDIELAWYSLQVLLAGFATVAWSMAPECTVLGINDLPDCQGSCKPSKIFWTKCTVINCDFIFHKTNVFGYFHSIIDQFKLVKHKFLN